MAATSATNAWAVDNRSHEDSRIWHWNGKRWRRVASPAIAGQTYSLGGVAATSAKNAWAVGTSSLGHTVILHWNGARWKRTPSPTPPAPVTLTWGVPKSFRAALYGAPNEPSERRRTATISV